MNKVMVFVAVCVSVLWVGVTGEANTGSAVSDSTQPEYAVSLYGGALTDEDWHRSITGQADFVDSQLLVAAVQRNVWGSSENNWSLGVEANMAKHFGTQEHWEFNLPVFTANWHAFPWQETLNQSVGFGMGPSVTTQRPRTEEELNPSSRHVMLYWHLETSFALPDSPWAVLFRLHHRSTAYGVFGDEGGSNALTTGLRYKF